MLETPFSISRDKTRGFVTVVIYNGAISTQKADSLARGMFTVPVKLSETTSSNFTNPTFVTRTYDAVGWL